MAKTENAKKVPGALVAAVVVIIAIAAFVPTVYMPYKNKKPSMDAAHQEALDTIAYLDKSIEDQTIIEADIKELNRQWEEYQKDMFIDYKATLPDLVDAANERNIIVNNVKTTDPVEDPSGTVTAEGNPLYYISIDWDFECDREQLLSFLQFIEKESVGCYYVKDMDLRLDSDVEDSDGNPIDKEMFNCKMKILLYYFDQTQTKVIISSETDTDTAA